MSMATRNAMSAYAQNGLDAKVASASPHRLITMLFDGAIAAVNKAKFHLERSQVTPDLNDFAEKGAAISRAMAIIDDGLSASLDVEAGGEIAENLKGLYEYMTRRLVEANLHNDLAGFDEVIRLLKEIRDAWDSISVHEIDKKLVQDEKTVNRMGAVTYGRV